MKKIIAISVMFVLLTGAAFAVDLGGSVSGTTTLFSGQSGDGADDEIRGDGGMTGIRIAGSGEAGDGQFGGSFRLEGVGGDAKPLPSGYVWWKPIDQLKIQIGGNDGDGFIGKEGVTGWGFYQTVNDSGVVDNGVVWGGGKYNFRKVFYEGCGDYGAQWPVKDGAPNLYLFITPVEMLAINIVLPYISMGGSPVADIFKHAVAQIDVNLDFGNIALTYRGGDEDAGTSQNIYLYYGGSFGDLGLDFGFSYTLNEYAGAKEPLGIGLGLKYVTDAFGVKFRGMVMLGGDDKATGVNAEVMPFFPLGDNLSVFVPIGLQMEMPEKGDTVVGWHFNPYLQIGEEWGAKFVVGARIWSGGDDVIKWAIPFGIIVGF